MNDKTRYAIPFLALILLVLARVTNALAHAPGGIRVVDGRTTHGKPDGPHAGGRAAGRNLIKPRASYKSMPTVEDVKNDLRGRGYAKERINDGADLKRIHHDRHREWLSGHRDDQKERVVREKQILLTEAAYDRFQNTDKAGHGYLPWTSIGYDYQDNTLEITIEPAGFTETGVEEYIRHIRGVVGSEIDITLSPMENRLESVPCHGRTGRDDPRAGAGTGAQEGEFPCGSGFEAACGNGPGFVTDGHGFDGLRPCTDAYHPGSADRARDPAGETAAGGDSGGGDGCGCALVPAAGDAGGGVRAVRSVADTGAPTDGGRIKAGPGASNPVPSGVILDANRSFNDPGRVAGPYHFKYVVLTDIGVKAGDGGSPVFSNGRQELLGFMAAKLGGDSVYVKHERAAPYRGDPTWDF